MGCCSPGASCPSFVRFLRQNTQWVPLKAGIRGYPKKKTYLALAHAGKFPIPLALLGKLPLRAVLPCQPTAFFGCCLFLPTLALDACQWLAPGSARELLPQPSLWWDTSPTARHPSGADTPARALAPALSRGRSRAKPLALDRRSRQKCYRLLRRKGAAPGGWSLTGTA